MPARSAKRGLAYSLSAAADVQAMAAGVTWWYGWGSQHASTLPADYATRYGMEFVPMLWNDRYDPVVIEPRLRSYRSTHLLVLNEPNLVEQANMTPQRAAEIWPGYERLAAATGVKIVGPQITWGTLPGYQDPIAWLDAFYAAYRTINGNRDPQIDALGFHWYDYGMAAQLDRLRKYGKPYWVTEFANWHSASAAARIDTVAKQQREMTQMVALCESRADVERYAWFTGRWTNDIHFTSVLGSAGQRTALGDSYVALPF